MSILSRWFEYRHFLNKQRQARKRSEFRKTFLRRFVKICAALWYRYRDGVPLQIN